MKIPFSVVSLAVGLEFEFIDECFYIFYYTYMGVWDVDAYSYIAGQTAIPRGDGSEPMHYHYISMRNEGVHKSHPEKNLMRAFLHRKPQIAHKKVSVNIFLGGDGA